MGKVFGKHVYESIEPGSDLWDEDEAKSGPDIFVLGTALLLIAAAGLFAYNSFGKPQSEPRAQTVSMPDHPPTLRGLSESEG